MRECPTCSSCFGDEVSRCPLDERQTFNSLPGEPLLDGRYVLERRLGEGGMGIVYKAHHKFLKTTRAIKIIKPELVGNDPSFATRFQQEAMTAAAIGHPNIISVPDYGFLGGEIPFLVMEFIEGESLQEVMSSEGKFSPEKALEYISVIGSAVGAAHAYGIFHRDLKPLNIMIRREMSPREGIRVLDFGLAKIKSADLFGSFVGAKTTGIIGSPYYMAPEQWSDEDIDKRCDIYSLGIILHQMLTGEVPFKGSSIPAVMKNHLMTPPPRLANASAGISKGLERVVHHALEKDPKLRTASAEEFVAELEKAVLGSQKAVLGSQKAVLGSQTADGKVGARKRTSAKAKATPRAKGSAVGRTTAEQKKAKAEETEIARHTADQEEAFRTTQNDEAQAIEGETLVGSKLLAVRSEIEQSGSQRDAGSQPTPNQFAVDDAIQTSAGGQDLRAKSREVEDEVHHRPEEGGPQLDALTDSDILRKAAVEARRRAEERALREAGDHSVEVLPPRVASLPPKLPGSASFPKLAVSRAPVKKSGSLGKPVLVALGAGALIFCAVVAYFLLRSKSASDVPVKAAAAEVPAGREMVFVKGGSFTMGSNSGPPEQQPAHLVTVLSFYMDKTEVTNQEYAAFVKETGHQVPASDGSTPDTQGYWKPWVANDPPPGRGTWPVANVSSQDAEAFAEWLSARDHVKYRLPTEAEWEYAARNGELATLFPWGNSWVFGRANMNEAASPVPAGSLAEGATKTGLLDMVGNVWEWTASKGSFYDPTKEAKEAQAANRAANVFRGGSFADKIDPGVSPTTNRVWNNTNPKYRHPGIGFRLVRDPTP